VAFWRSEGNAVAQVLRKPAEELTREDALHVACPWAILAQACVRGWTKPLAAAGFATTMEFFAMWMTEEPISSSSIHPAAAHGAPMAVPAARGRGLSP
jgi:hypothetical protein